MKKITITIKDKTLIFKYRTNKPVEPNLLNTNVISNNELIFSDEYIIENEKLVRLFIGDLAKEREITEISVTNNNLGELIIGIIKNIPIIEKFTITDDVNLSYALCEGLIKLKKVKKINCYGIPQFMIENLDKNDIAVDSRYEVLFTSNFMADNNLTSFSKIYYKSNIRIGEILTPDDVNDIKTFLAINKYLKVIHFEKYSLDNIKILVKLLKEAKRKNILIEIHDDLDNNEDVTELREINKSLKKKNKISISLVYSKDFLEKNYLQQIIFTTLKFCAIIIFSIVVSVLGYIVYNNYQSETKINGIKEELLELMKEENLPEDDGSDETDIDEPDENASNMINSYNKLYEVNSDTVGWLTVKGTKIDYPVVKATDNSYYLNRNIYKEKDYNGWPFMDYRNTIDFLDDNTIIYAHNRYTSGVMFGTLPNIAKANWLNKKDNHYITFNTLYKEMKWQIFSYYGIDVTSDYLITNFSNNTDKQEFFNMLAKRSEYNFNVSVDADDKILTLSTCLDNNRRFVVHAVLVNDGE